MLVSFTFHPPTRTFCQRCEYADSNLEPIVDYQRGKASSADNFPVHNWFNFVLGYSPEFPEFMFKKFGLSKDSFIADPFAGSGTTLVCAKTIGMKSVGVEANDYFYFAATAKLEWRVSTDEIIKQLEIVRKKYNRKHLNLDWSTEGLESPEAIKKPFSQYAAENRPDMLDVRYLSDHSFAQFQLLKSVLQKIEWEDSKLRDAFYFAMSAILVPCSNVRYGPGFGVTKKVRVVDVFSEFEKKIVKMSADLLVDDVRKNKRVNSKIILGDSRILSSYLPEKSLDAMITSPPYPGDHEYTKHSRLELIFGDYAQSLSEFRNIKKRMLRGSTTNIYKDDNLGELVSSLTSISDVTKEIDKRLVSDGATSGFEKLYSKLVREYFGGMFLVFLEAKKVLKEGAPFSLLVSDSHAFKMVHISTAEILAEVAKTAGFESFSIDLWQLKKTTSHGYQLREDILTVW